MPNVRMKRVNGREDRRRSGSSTGSSSANRSAEYSDRMELIFASPPVGGRNRPSSCDQSKAGSDHLRFVFAHAVQPGFLTAWAHCRGMLIQKSGLSATGIL